VQVVFLARVTLFNVFQSLFYEMVGVFLQSGVHGFQAADFFFKFRIFVFLLRQRQAETLDGPGQRVLRGMVGADFARVRR